MAEVCGIRGVSSTPGRPRLRWFDGGGLSMIRPGSGIWQMLTDPDEGLFLQALLAPAGDRRPLLEYADHLRGRDPAREEFLRLEHLLSGPGHLDGIGAERQGRYRELMHLLAP